MRQYILMADIIDSSGKPGKPLMEHFKSMVANINDHYKDKISSPLTITLGDEFQGVIKSLKAAIDIIFAMDEILLKSKVPYTLRFVLNYGNIDTPITKGSAYEMLGEGLTKARNLLSELKSDEGEILVQGISERKGATLNMAFRLYRSIYNDWGEKDKLIVASFLKEIDYKKVAKIYNRDISTMWRREKSLKIDEFKISRDLILNLAYE